MSPEGETGAVRQPEQAGEKKVEGKGIWVALIGAIATIIAGYFTYAAAIRRTEPSLGPAFTFSGIVKDDEQKGIANARVSVTADQSTPQTTLSDAYGDFSVQLPQNTTSVLIGVDAGKDYDTLSVHANPHRTGPEIINLHKKNSAVTRRDELVKPITEFEARLADVEQIARQLEQLENAAPDQRQGPSVLIWRIWYGETYASPDYHNVRWKDVLLQIKNLGVTKDFNLAFKAIEDIEEGDREGIHQTSSYLKPRLKTLREYQDTVLEPILRRE